ncbi:MAG: hypothetical protein FWF92_00345 [Oscillospiraceae bacterium]|nr:hypothetical protein [Oscillospiraceae bacterium]
MSLKHKICISVSRPNNETSEIIKSGSRTIRSKLLKFLFGEKVGVLILTPGRTVETVEIREVPERGDDGDENAEPTAIPTDAG